MDKVTSSFPEDAGDGGSAASQAALLLIESLLLTLMDRDVLKEDEIDDIFEAAIQAHKELASDVPSDLHRRVEQILRRIQTQGNSVSFDRM